MTIAVLTFDLMRDEVVAIKDGQELVIKGHQLRTGHYWLDLPAECRAKLGRYFRTPTQKDTAS